MTAKLPSRDGRRRLPLAARALILALLVLAGLAAAHSLLWRWMGTQLEDGFAIWAQTRRAQGWSVEHGVPVRGGWPLSATLTVPALRLAGGGATIPGGMAWQAEAVVLRLVPPRLDQLTVEMRGRQQLRLGPSEIPYTADRLQAVLPLEPGVLPREAEFEAEHVRVGTAAGAVEVRRAQGRIETRYSAIEGEPALSLVLAAEGLELPPGLSRQPAPSALGRRIESAALDAVVTGPVPAGRHPAERAAAWRDGGGTLELRSLNLRWGSVAGETAATLTLDDALQPMGAGTVRLSGVQEALDALAAAGAVGPHAAQTAKAVLGLMARPSEDGGAPQVEVPLTLEDRTLTVARIPVARFAPLAWPQAGTREGGPVPAAR